ncbi:MAG: hypothetical protein M3463_10135 [Verrucomicrobiota bacterium]|nr:hypothetical protein [Verrucomicrobiota bacterium]
MKQITLTVLVAFLHGISISGARAQQDDKLRIIVFGRQVSTRPFAQTQKPPPSLGEAQRETKRWRGLSRSSRPGRSRERSS